jgi:hypothetical protein
MSQPCTRRTATTSQTTIFPQSKGMTTMRRVYKPLEVTSNHPTPEDTPYITPHTLNPPHNPHRSQSQNTRNFPSLSSRTWLGTLKLYSRLKRAVRGIAGLQWQSGGPSARRRRAVLLEVKLTKRAHSPKHTTTSR